MVRCSFFCLCEDGMKSDGLSRTSNTHPVWPKAAHWQVYRTLANASLTKISSAQMDVATRVLCETKTCDRGSHTEVCIMSGLELSGSNLSLHASNLLICKGSLLAKWPVWDSCQNREIWIWRQNIQNRAYVQQSEYGLAGLRFFSKSWNLAMGTRWSICNLWYVIKSNRS